MMNHYNATLYYSIISYNLIYRIMGLFDKFEENCIPLTTYPENEDYQALCDWFYGTNVSGLNDYYDVVFSVGGYGVERWFEDKITLRHITGWDARSICSLSGSALDDWYRKNGGTLYITPQTIEIVEKIRV